MNIVVLMIIGVVLGILLFYSKGKALKREEEKQEEARQSFAKLVANNVVNLLDEKKKEEGPVLLDISK